MTLKKLPKKNKLKSKKKIENLFQKGKIIKNYPLKILFLKTQKLDFQVAFSVPKKNMPKAVDRTKIKRKMRANFQNLEKYPENMDLIIIFIGQKKEQHFNLQKIIARIQNLDT